MNSLINGRAINGAVFASWVVRASATVAAAAVVAGCAANRITHAAAHGNAAVVVSLSYTHHILARATGTTEITSSIAPTQRLAGGALFTGKAAGHAAVRRYVGAEASADAGAYGDALTAQAIGDASAAAQATVEQSKAHVIHPGVVRLMSVANGVAASDVTRYAVVAQPLGRALPAWGEASVRRKGQAFFEHDGYVDAVALGGVAVDHDKTRVVVTYGAFDFGNTQMDARTFIMYSAQARGDVKAAGLAAIANHVFRPRTDEQAVGRGEGIADGVRVVNPASEALAQVVGYNSTPRVRYAARAVAAATGTTEQAQARRMAVVRQAQATARATLMQPIVLGRQYWGQSTTGWGESDGLQAQANVHYLINTDVAVAGATAVDCVGSIIFQGAVDDAIATALWGRAYALLNSDVRAPDERYMLLPPEDRHMLVAAQDRVMVTI